MLKKSEEIDLRASGGFLNKKLDVGGFQFAIKHHYRGGFVYVLIESKTKRDYTFNPSGFTWCYAYMYIQDGVTFVAKRSMFEREKLSETNFNDRLRRLKLALRVNKKMFVIEHPILSTPAAVSEANVQSENYSPYEMLQELKSMFEKQAGVERFDLIQTFHSCKQEEGKPVGADVFKMKDYKANKKSLKAKGKGKSNGKGNDKQVYIPKPKNPKVTAKEHPAKDDTCHHYKEVGHWKRNCLVYLAEFLKKKKQVVTASSLDNCHYAPSITRGVALVHRLVEKGFVQCLTGFGILVSKNNVLYFNAIPCNGIYEIDMHDLVPNVNFIYNVSTKRAKHNLDSTYLWHCRLAHISKKRIEKLQQEWLLKSTDDESFDQCISCLSGKMTRKSFPHRPERATDLLGIIDTDLCGLLRHVLRHGASYFITFTDDYSLVMFIFLSINMRSFKHSRCLRMKWKINSERQLMLFDQIEVALVKRDTPDKLQEEVILICRSDMTYRAPNRLCLNVEVEEHNLGDLNEPTSYKAATLDLESNKWLDAMNEKMQSMIDNNKKIDMDGVVHTYKARLVAKQLYEVDYEETFSPVADIRAIRIFKSLAAFYDYEIRQMDVKTAFLNGYLDEDIYMVQPEGAVDWKSSKQSTTAIATEAEYIAASEAVMEAVWIESLFQGLRGATHYHRRYHYVRECNELDEINLLKVHTYDNLADPFTKVLPKGKLTQHSRSIGLHLAGSFM
uniref:Retrotransposon protein, putative, Ty1-copia subclass n=1 Tax=Tanacetum cinerariifolium TaxID=118510 RepID=A0A6L2MXD4_TANCI|nr:retrotransposon protein, putative, Ty1-copia subclass [Tanacetum cinerariifolium]